MECHSDWEEEEEEDEMEGGVCEWEVRGRPGSCSRRWEGNDRCKDYCRRTEESDYYDDDEDYGWRQGRKDVNEKRGRLPDCHRMSDESNYCDEDEYDGRWWESKDVNERHGRFNDCDRKRWKQKGSYDDEDDLDLRQQERRGERERRDFEFEGAVDMKRGGARRYGEDGRRFDWRRERRDFEFDDAVDDRMMGAKKYSKDDQRYDRRRERMNFAFDDGDTRRREVRRHHNKDQRFARKDRRSEDSEKEEEVSFLGSRHGHEHCHYDEQDMVENKYYSGERSQKSARASALGEDDSWRASSSRNTVDTRDARKEDNSASRVRWHDSVDQQGVRRTQQTFEGRGGRCSSLVGWSGDERVEYHHAYEDAQFVRERDSRMGAQDVRVITEYDTNLATSSKNTSILKHHSNTDKQIAAHKDESKKSSQNIMEISEVRNNATERDSRAQRYHQEDRGKYIEDKSSSIQNSVKLTNDSRRQMDQRVEVDQQLVTLSDSRKNEERLTDISVDSTHNVSRASHLQRKYDEVRQTDIDDRSTSIHNITHVTRDKKRYVNQQVIHETDIDVQNITHVDVSKVRASDVDVSKVGASNTAVSRSSQSHLETRLDVSSTSDVNLIGKSRGWQEQINQDKVRASDSSIFRGSRSHLETGIDDQVHLTSAVNITDSTRDRQDHIDLIEAHATNAASSMASESHLETRRGDQFHSTSAVNLIGSARARQEQIDLIRVHDSDATIVSSSQGHFETRSDNQVCTSSSVNVVDRARESRDTTAQQMALYSSIERNDGVSTQVSESSQDTGGMLASLQEIDRLAQDKRDVNWQKTGTSRIPGDKDLSTLPMESTEEGSFMFNVDEAQRRRLMGNSQQPIRNETTVGSIIASGSSSRHSVKDSSLASAARLEKSSTYHVGRFVDELHKEVSDVDTALTHKNGKSIMEGVTRSSSRSGVREPSDEMWDVQSANSQETFKTADKEEAYLAVEGTNSASQTPKTETAVARRAHKSLWAFVADIIHLGWINRGESHESTKKSAKQNSSTNSQGSEGWFSSQEHDDDDIRKKSGSTTLKDQQLIKLKIGESDSSTASMLKQESMHTGKQGLQISEVGNISEVGISKGVLLAKSSSIDVQRSGERSKTSEVDASPKAIIVGGLPVDSTSPLVDVREGLPETEVATSSRITVKGSSKVDIGKGGLFAETSSMTIGAEEAGWNSYDDSRRTIPSGAIAPYHHPQTQTMVTHDNTSAALPELSELPAGGSTRFEEKLAVQEAPRDVRTEGKDAELNRRKFQRNKQVLKDTFDEWEEAYQRDAEQRKTDELFMREALLEAQRAADMWEVPVGAVLVQNGEIIARGCNLVEDLRDSTAHAEMICIREASNKLRTWRLADTTLYVTLEPCAMCAGAILQARINTVVWGAPNNLLGADGSWVRLFPGDGQTSTLDSASRNQTPGPVHPFHPKITIRRGVLTTDCAEIMQQFFQLRRKKKQKPELPPPPCLPVPNHPIKFFSKMHHMFNAMFCM